MIFSDKFSQKNAQGLYYDDVYIIPKYSEITTRKHVNIGLHLPKLYSPRAYKESIPNFYPNEEFVKVPIISSNMETVTGPELAIKMQKAGALAALHRFNTIEEAVKEFETVEEGLDFPYHGNPTFVSVGVNRDSKERTEALYHAGARYFIIDIAHGHSKNMEDMLRWMKTQYDTQIYIMAGNVATSAGAWDVAAWGADAVKSGLAGGSVCITKDVTGVTIPMVSSLLQCSNALNKFSHQYKRKVHLVADGGCKQIGDVSKALACGADLIMSGRFFAGCPESPEGLTYRGSASQDVQVKYRTDKSAMPTPEGRSEIVEETGSVKEVVDLIAGGLKSSFSYVNAANMEEFHRNATFGIKYNRT